MVELKSLRVPLIRLVLDQNVSDKRLNLLMLALAGGTSTGGTKELKNSLEPKQIKELVYSFDL